MLILAMGWGFRAQAQTTSFANCWAQAGDRLKHLSAPHAWHGFALEHKWASPAGRLLQAWQCSHPALSTCMWHSVCRESLAHIATPTQSPVTQQRFDTGSVCEAMALFGVAMLFTSSPHQDARQLLPPRSLLKQTRVVSNDRLATLAIAMCSTSTPRTS